MWSHEYLMKNQLIWISLLSRFMKSSPHRNTISAKSSKFNDSASIRELSIFKTVDIILLLPATDTEKFY